MVNSAKISPHENLIGKLLALTEDGEADIGREPVLGAITVLAGKDGLVIGVVGDAVRVNDSSLGFIWGNIAELVATIAAVYQQGDVWGFDRLVWCNECTGEGKVLSRAKGSVGGVVGANGNIPVQSCQEKKDAKL